MMKDKKVENKPGLPWDILSPDAEADEKFISLVMRKAARSGRSRCRLSLQEKGKAGVKNEAVYRRCLYA